VIFVFRGRTEAANIFFNSFSVIFFIVFIERL
jgi:hypothetical protein